MSQIAPIVPVLPTQPICKCFAVYNLRFASLHGMEEVIGSIPIRSTKQPNNLDDMSTPRQSVGVIVCVIPPISLLLERATIAVRFASTRTCEYVSGIRWLACPAIAGMVESAAPLSASYASCLLSRRNVPSYTRPSRIAHVTYRIAQQGRLIDGRL